MLGVVVCSALAGAIISYWGYYWPFLVFGPMFCSVGGGLLYTVTEETPMSRIIGYQIVSLLFLIIINFYTDPDVLRSCRWVSDWSFRTRSLLSKPIAMMRRRSRKRPLSYVSRILMRV